MVAACRFHDGAVIIADTRAIWLPGGPPLIQDSLQKILPLTRRIAIAFAADDVPAAEYIIRQIRSRMRAKPRLQHLRKLAGTLQRTAKHDYEVYVSRTRRRKFVAFVLAGITDHGQVEIWQFESPDLKVRKVECGFAVIGSGRVVAPYIAEQLKSLDEDLPDLKSRADKLARGLEAELQRFAADTVGGLLQIILVQPDGIRPLPYGFVNLDPDHPAEAMEIEARAGRWTQRDLTGNREVPLLEPAVLLTRGPSAVRVQDFKSPDPHSAKPHFHLAYFLTCLQVESDVGSIEFRGVFSALGSAVYPLTFNIPVAFGLWGSPGNHGVRLSVYKEGAQPIVTESTLHIEHLPEEHEFLTTCEVNLEQPGTVFLELHVEDQLLARRALYFGQAIETPAPNEPRSAFGRRVIGRLLREQRACTDPQIEETGESFLVYLSLCQSCRDEETLLRFSGQIMVVYWKNYPLPLRVFLASAFRLSRGEHRLKVDLVNAASRRTSTITTATITSSSSCIVSPVHGDLIILVPEPGFYFVNVYVDDVRCGTALFVAETDAPHYSYVPMDADLARVTAGELLVLQKRSPQAPTVQ